MVIFPTQHRRSVQPHTSPLGYCHPIQPTVLRGMHTKLTAMHQESSALLLHFDLILIRPSDTWCQEMKLWNCDFSSQLQALRSVFISTRLTEYPEVSSSPSCSSLHSSGYWALTRLPMCLGWGLQHVLGPSQWRRADNATKPNSDTHL